ncbi:MAG TPA: LLM class flavin-dependent oxidoreductase [Ilumatobacteraceae bacterium]|nr:LLM class flavin-dependent oxidoreductase [Ilumatobacteraceae bacterium]
MVDISCAFATSMATPEYVALAEELGYRRAWLYDSPALYPDVWMMLAECARRTSTIEIGPGVAIPSLRHPMVTAAAIGTLVELAPGRVNVAIGSGFTGRLTLGQKPLPWTFVREYVLAVQGLLAGETVEWEGAPIRMMHPDGFGAPRPISVPIILGTGGPKGEAVAREIGDGVFVTSPTTAFDWCSVLTLGTVLDDGEDPGSERSMAAAGHAGGLAFHAIHLSGSVTSLPGGDVWLAALEEFPERERHLALHEGHLIEANERDRLVVTGELLAMFKYAQTAESWRDLLAERELEGATEIAYQPAGPDIPGELRRFMEMASG